MTLDESNKEEKFDFDQAGEELGYISLEQARLLAMQTARDDPGNYGRRFAGMRMVYQPVEQEAGEDYYFVTMSFRPEGDFRGSPGQEQFVVEKEGAIAYRQVLSYPSGGGGWRSLRMPIAIGGAVVAIVVAAVGVAFAGGFLGGGGEGKPPVVAADPPNTPSLPGAAAFDPTLTPTIAPVGTSRPADTRVPIDALRAPLAPRDTPAPAVKRPVRAENTPTPTAPPPTPTRPVIVRRATSPNLRPLPTPTPTLAPRPTPRPTSSPTPVPTAAETTQAGRPVVARTLEEFCARVSLNVESWDLPPRLPPTAETGTVVIRYRVPLGAQFETLFFIVDTTVRTKGANILAKYPDAPLEPDVVYYKGLHPVDRFQLTTDGLWHIRTIPIKVPAESQFIATSGPGGIGTWSDFVQPPYEIRTPPGYAANFSLNGRVIQVRTDPSCHETTR